MLRAFTSSPFANLRADVGDHQAIPIPANSAWSRPRSAWANVGQLVQRRDRRARLLTVDPRGSSYHGRSDAREARPASLWRDEERSPPRGVRQANEG